MTNINDYNIDININIIKFFRFRNIYLPHWITGTRESHCS